MPKVVEELKMVEIVVEVVPMVLGSCAEGGRGCGRGCADGAWKLYRRWSRLF